MATRAATPAPFLSVSLPVVHAVPSHKARPQGDATNHASSRHGAVANFVVLQPRGFEQHAHAIAQHHLLRRRQEALDAFDDHRRNGLVTGGRQRRQQLGRRRCLMRPSAGGEARQAASE